MDFSAWMSGVQRRTESALERLLPAAATVPARLHEAMRYSALDGGKRVRPLLVHGAGLILGASADLLDRAACAVEMIHVYSLIHDDLPCMDDDTLRRGKPTCHVEFDEATALLAGDALQPLAFAVLAETALPPQQVLAMVGLLAHAAGSRGMAGGQAFDLAATGKSLTLEELEFMHIHKTGALIRAAVLLGAHCGSADPAILARLTHYANRIGLLFQVVDDILDTESDTATLGKTAGKDASRNKPTYASLLGTTAARAKARELHGQAREVLESFGDSALRLRQLADYIIERDF
ncbi:MAG: polyprenyl synthetase family protein [Proteobacteria bacterium]|nr:polyprenyl synthetase family protein [Pseudomonadota bacterium]HQR03139.1 polyprenyl synthetase family protein [Rhodocyclaceae bacterium]